MHARNCEFSVTFTIINQDMILDLQAVTFTIIGGEDAVILGLRAKKNIPYAAAFSLASSGWSCRIQPAGSAFAWPAVGRCNDKAKRIKHVYLSLLHTVGAGVQILFIDLRTGVALGRGPGK